MSIVKVAAYLNSVRATGHLHARGLPFVPKGLSKLSPFNREVYNTFLVDATGWKLGPKPVIYDVGANNGDFALAFQTVFPDARITLFEPLADHVARLESIKATGGFPWVIKDVALGASNESLEIEIPEGQSAASSFHGFGEDYLKHNPDARNTRKQMCKVRRLDEISPENSETHRIDLLKIDVEGFEFATLEGASQTLARVDNVVVEVSRLRHGGTPGCPVAKMIRLMEEAGLVLFKVEPTVVNEALHSYPLEYDLYFTRFGKVGA